jgi:hypothetical protein
LVGSSIDASRLVPNRLYSARFTESPPPSPPLDGGRPRRFRVSLIGSYTFETTGLALAAVEHARQILRQVFEQYGVQLAVSGVEVEVEVGVLEAGRASRSVLRTADECQQFYRGQDAQAKHKAE